MDQTVNEGLKQGIGPVKLRLMMQALTELPIGSTDVWVKEWEENGLHSYNVTFHSFLRGKIKPNLYDLYRAYHLGFDKIIIVYSHVSRKQTSKRLYPVLAAASKLHLSVSLFIENAAQISAVDIDYYLKLIIKFDIKSFIYGDKESLLDSFAVFEALSQIYKILPCVLEFHAHNSYGLATANSLSAIKAGVRRVAASVAGVGTPCHAALEEVLIGSKYILQETIPATGDLAALCAHILACMGQNVPVRKAVIGTDVFAHESGLHVQGVVQNPSLYEAFSPEEVGLVRRLVIGKHSGSMSLRVKLNQIELYPSDQEIAAMLPKVRKLAVVQKGCLNDEQLQSLYFSERKNSYEDKRGE
ncbi:pyruvate carboxyltransferase [Propionispora sp. 2/2-37]|uniref:homocitrate synthase/isopropylmalate synthase family protein n=1 Tax=Propionispora sp. 2/2-37 TaxID=1677858 RepID=UPI00155D8D11|nr:pyruvate carboxyltransferase [Propionispora sp. 2/2-37]